MVTDDVKEPAYVHSRPIFLAEKEAHDYVYVGPTQSLRIDATQADSDPVQVARNGVRDGDHDAKARKHA